MQRHALIVLTALLAACKAKAPATGDAAGACRQGQKKVDVQPPADSADAAPRSGIQPSAGAGAPPPVQNPTTYLLSSDDASKLTPIVEAYRQPAYADPAASFTQKFERYRAFTEGFLNRVMALQPLAPGRRIAVHIADDNQVNAFAGAFQDVTINSGTIAAADGVQLLAVLCHELGHSARNHSVKTVDYESQAGFVDAINAYAEAREAYFKRSYNEGTQTYTHDVAGFQQVNKLWQAIKPRLDLFAKREESEADVVGAEICGHLGMPTDTYINALATFLSAGDAADAANAGADAKTVDQIDAGDRFQLDKDSLGSFLFPSDSHPSNEERKVQLTRLRSVVGAHYEQAPLFDEWKSGYQGAKGLGLAGLSLTEAVQQNVVTVQTESGKSIKIKLPHLCGGGHRFK
jgi:Zn-dependent protease with chaperone function